MRTQPSPWILLGPSLAGLLLTSCWDAPTTQIVVVVDTDYSVPGELNRLLLAAGDSEFVAATIDFDDPGAPDLPVSVTLIPDEGVEHVEVVVSGRSDDTSLVEVAGSGSFVPGQSLVMHLFLKRGCDSSACPAMSTCGVDGACVSVDQDPLPDWNGPP